MIGASDKILDAQIGYILLLLDYVNCRRVKLQFRSTTENHKGVSILIHSKSSFFSPCRPLPVLGGSRQDGYVGNLIRLVFPTGKGNVV